MKDNVIFWRDWDEAVRTLPDKDQAEAYRAVLDYALDDVIYTGNNIGIKMLLQFLKPRIDEQTERYKSVCERNRNNGQRGGRPRKNPEKPNETQENPLGFSETNSKPNETQENPIKDKGYKDKGYKDKGYNNKNTTPNGDSVKSAPRFRKPSIEELQEYAREKGYMWDVERFYDYYESNGWKVGRNAMKDWKAAMRNWNKGEHEGRQPQAQQPQLFNQNEDAEREAAMKRIEAAKAEAGRRQAEKERLEREEAERVRIERLNRLTGFDYQPNNNNNDE